MEATNSTSSKKRNASIVSKSFVGKVVDTLALISTKKHKVTDVKLVAEAFVNLLVTSTSNGESITFTNLFTFKRALRENRTHKNPRDNTPIFKPAHYVLTMEVKPQLKEHFGQIPVTKEGEVVEDNRDDNDNEDNDNEDNDVEVVDVTDEVDIPDEEVEDEIKKSKSKKAKKDKA